MVVASWLQVRMDGRPSTQGVSLRLWEDCRQEVQDCLNNPFVVGLGNGTLPRWSIVALGQLILENCTDVTSEGNQQTVAH